jgi:hypothetical protein
MYLPHTLDLSSWYFGVGMAPLVLMLMVAVYSFRTSLAGRPLITARLP